MATAPYKLIARRAVYQQLYSFFNNTSVGIFVSLTTSIDSGLHKLVETFETSVLNEVINFCAYESQLQVKR